MTEPTDIRREATLESRLGRAGDSPKLDAQATGTDAFREPKPRRAQDRSEEASAAPEREDPGSQGLGHP